MKKLNIGEIKYSSIPKGPKGMQQEINAALGGKNEKKRENVKLQRSYESSKKSLVGDGSNRK